jgi:hypothetical protein
MSKLVIVAPKGRAFCGRAVLVGSDGATRAGPFRVLATASVRIARKHGNTDASPLLPFGHPPTGTYVIAASLPPGYTHKRRTRRYGRVGALLLAPQSGDALRATSSGRKLVAMHGGPRDRKRRLRPTRGGIRFSNAQMTKLLSAINAAHRDGDPLASIELMEIDLPPPRARDRRGHRRVAPRRPRKKASYTPMLLLPFALGGAGKGKMARREMLLAASVVFGALALEACDRPSRCSPLWCPSYDPDAGDAGGAGDAGADGGRVRCTRDGYACDPYGGYG